MTTELRDGLLVLLASVALLVWCFSPVWQPWLRRKRGRED